MRPFEAGQPGDCLLHAIEVLRCGSMQYGNAMVHRETKTAVRITEPLRSIPWCVRRWHADRYASTLHGTLSTCRMWQVIQLECSAPSGANSNYVKPWPRNTADVLQARCGCIGTWCEHMHLYRTCTTWLSHVNVLHLLIYCTDCRTGAFAWHTHNHLTNSLTLPVQLCRVNHPGGKAWTRSSIHGGGTARRHQ